MKYLRELLRACATLTLIMFLSSDAFAGVIVLEGSDANGYHAAYQPTLVQPYTTQMLRLLRGTSSLPVLVLRTEGTPTTTLLHSGIPVVFTSSLSTASPTFSATNYSALYIMSPGGCCDDGRGLVTSTEQAAIAGFVAAGGSLGIQDFQGGDWGTSLGFAAPASAVGGFRPPFASAGGSTCFDGVTVTPEGFASGFTPVPALGCFGHQGYDMSYFGPLGYTALISPPAGSFPAGFAAVVAKLCQPPAISGMAATPSILWPVNHKYVPVYIEYSAASACGGTCFLTVSSNEAANMVGAGQTDPDWVITDAHNVQLRAERSGTGADRVYSILITCSNPSGIKHQTVVVRVPHDQGAK